MSPCEMRKPLRCDFGALKGAFVFPNLPVADVLLLLLFADAALSPFLRVSAK